jgi:hypothetical protein
MKFYEQFNKYMEEASIEKLTQQDPREVYDEPKGELGKQGVTGVHPNDAFKSLEDALDTFYNLGKGGLGADPAAVHDRVYNMLQQHEVDDRDIQRFSDVLTSIILGQSTRGFADSQD